jgi:flagellar hook-associated protein 1
MSDLLNLGAQGVRGYSRALQTVGDNIANAQTPGFARRSTVLAEQVASGEAVFYRNQVSPGGVLAVGVSRASDPWLVEDARSGSSDAARASARLNWLEATEAVLADGGGGVGGAMTGLFNRADELAADPTSSARRSAFLSATDDVASTFRRTADGLARAAEGVGTAAGLTAQQVNADVDGLARVNEGLRRACDGSSNQATLLDERDRLIDSIAAALPVDIVYDAKGAAALSLDGASLISGNTRVPLTVSTAADGRLALAAGGSTVTPTSGTLSGQIDAAAHIANQRGALDTLAAEFTTSINTQHAAGRDAIGNPGTPLLTIVGGATTLSAVSLAIGEVAAADAGSANSNALAFGNLRTSTGSEASWAALVAQQSQSVAGARAQESVASTRRDGAATARDTVSAVDLDREAADLLRYQQAYEASARVIQVARETMQTILNVL